MIEPCGFPLTDRAAKRAALDYGAAADLVRHVSFEAFRGTVAGRLVLVETQGNVALHDFAFQADDTLVLGRESAGSPPELFAAADAVVRIPMAAGLRSLNVVTAATLALGEALRQTGGFRSLE